MLGWHSQQPQPSITRSLAWLQNFQWIKSNYINHNKISYTEEHRRLSIFICCSLIPIIQQFSFKEKSKKRKYLKVNNRNLVYLDNNVFYAETSKNAVISVILAQLYQK
jgi:hypothetical protein